MPKNTHLDFAVILAREAGEVMRKNFTLGMRKEWKRDDTPITATDKKINRMVLKATAKAYPDYAVLSEEGSRMKKSAYTWVCDPVDGTVGFSHGYPTFVFSLALVKNGKSILGVVYDPIGDRLVYAQKGKGAFLNGQKISVSRRRIFSKTAFINLDSERLPAVRAALLEKDCYVTTFYAAIYPSLLVAAGIFLAEIYDYTCPWDGAAVKVIVEEAGGKVTDFAGKEQRYDRNINGFIASNGLVHDKLVALVQQARRISAPKHL